ncbi:MAG: pantoate--beta-alanine ligase [Eubacteriales bacterium]|nr:pantoate--beta-alanine ligase [Eubacteriales bacterium]
MEIASTIQDVRTVVKLYQNAQETIGLVPTMGYLHTGHVSLIEKARKSCDRVIVSIFVNPIQFGPNEDYTRYPRDLERDLELCRDAGADLVFIPEVADMYPKPNLTFADVKTLGDHLCGASRPGHFQGVLTVVAKLFNICQPDQAFFGEKDAQQLAIIRRMVADFNFPVEIVPCPIIREADGLAMSSRNVYLSEKERQAALSLSRSLEKAWQALETGERSATVIRDIIRSGIAAEPLARIDYVEVVDGDTLQPVTTISGSVLAAVAVFFGKTRLIDNFTFRPE